MKTTLKRTLSLVLTVCMLLSVLPFAAFAETPTYSWSGVGGTSSPLYVAINQLLPGSDNEREIELKYVSEDIGITSDSKINNYLAHYRITFDNKASAANSFHGFRFNTVPAGNYTVEFTLDSANSQTKEFTFHVFSIDDFSEAPETQSYRTAVVAEAITAGSHQIGDPVSITKNETTSISFTAELPERPVIVMAVTNPANTKKILAITGINFYAEASTPSGTVYGILNGTTELTSEQAVIDALMTNGNSVKLMEDVNLGDEAALNSGATVDLNGKTLSGLSAALVTVTGTGSVAVKPTKVAAGYVALADGNNGYSVVTCTIKTDAPAKNDNNVNFWYRVEFGTADAYALAKNDAGFKIGANITVNSESVNAEFSDELVNAWADAMANDDGKVCFRVTINDAAAIGMDLVATVNGVANGSSMTYTA